MSNPAPTPPLTPAAQARLIATLVAGLADMGEHSESGSRAYGLVRSYAESLADMLAAGNPRLSREAFLTAAGIHPVT